MKANCYKDDAAEVVPEKLIYLLEHKYSQANLRGSALKGVDAHKVAMLDMLARAHGFHIGLASVVCHEHGYARDEGPPPRRGGWGRWYEEEDDEDDDDVEMEEVQETVMTVEHLVDLDGKLIQPRLEFDEETETIPCDLEEMVTNGDVDEQEYEGYLGNVSLL